MPDPNTLLERHRPQLRYDSQDPYRACSALTIVENAGNKLVDSSGGLIAAVGDAARALVLGSLGAGDGRKGERLDEQGDERKIMRDAVRMQGKPKYADRTYWRCKQVGDTTYLQYWFWLYYNPKDVAGRGRHEGDWEMIQIRLEGERPVCAVYAAHAHAMKTRWDDIEVHTEGDGVHPVVYVAAESHASYFEAGTHPAFGRADNAFGDGPKVIPALEEFGPWAEWPGRWGNSKGVLWWLPIARLRPPAGKSPESPGHQETKWLDPAKFEAQAKDYKPKKERALWKFGRRSYPLKPEIVEARLEGDRAIVKYRANNRPLRRRTQHLLITVDADGEVLGRVALRNADHEGEVTVPLVKTPERAEVLVSAFNRRRQRSEVESEKVVQAEPDRPPA
jgi:hypothetical protein